MESNYHKEIVELHRFFEKWFNGEIADTDGNLDRFLRVLDEHFAIVNPEGRIITRDALLRWLRSAYASHTNLRIWVDNIQLQQQYKDVLIVSYKEWQETSNSLTVRHSSVIFREDAHAPNDVLWMYVHETWLSR